MTTGAASSASDPPPASASPPLLLVRQRLLRWRRRWVVASARRRRETAAASVRRSMVGGDGGDGDGDEGSGGTSTRQQQWQLHRKRRLLSGSGTALFVPPLPLPLPLPSLSSKATTAATGAFNPLSPQQQPQHYRPRIGPADDVATDPFAIEMLELPAFRRRQQRRVRQMRRGRRLRRRGRAGGDREQQEQEARASEEEEEEEGSARPPLLFLRWRRQQRELERGGARLRGLVLGLAGSEEQQVERERERGDGGRAPSGAGEVVGEGEDEEEDEESFWAFRSKDVDVEALLAGDEAETTAATCAAHWAAYRALAADHRLVLAGRVLDKVEAFLLRSRPSSSSAQDDDAAVAGVRRALASPAGQRRARLLRRRLRECEGALEELERDEGWTLSQRLFGVDTYYQYVQEGQQGDGNAAGGRLALRVKLDGLLEQTRAHDLFAVLKEADVWTRFIPFCDRSSIVHEWSKADMLVHFNVAVPFLFLQRDALLHVYACDRADACPAPNNNDEAEETKDERGGRGSTSSDSRSSNSSAPSIIFVGESVRDEWLAGEWMEEDDDASLPTAADMDVHRLALPKAPGAGRRMELKGFRAQIVVISATTVRIRVVTTVDPKAPLPQAVLNFCTKKIAGMLIHVVKQQARRMNDDPARDPLAMQVRRRRPFYEQYLRPRIRQFCEAKGWDVVPMAALEASSPDDPPLLGRRRADHHHRGQQQQRQQQYGRRRRHRHRQRRRRDRGEEDGDVSDFSYSSSSSSSSWWSEEGHGGHSEGEVEGQAVVAAPPQPLPFLAGARLIWARQPRWLRIGLAYLLATTLLPFAFLPSCHEAWPRALVVAPPVFGLLLVQWAVGLVLDD